LQTTKVESQTPPQSRPAGETVATAVLEELKVNVVVTAVFAEFTAEALTVTTSPATNDTTAGDINTWATVVALFVEDPPPQPATRLTRREMTATRAAAEAKIESWALLPRLLRVRWMNINIEEFSV
jgi:hypothetical protein